MKKILFMFVMLLMSVLTVNAQEAKQNYTREGNTIILSTGERKSSSKAATETKFKVKDTDGKEYTVYMGSTGSCFIKKVSKNGKEYRKYLGTELSQMFCKELGVEYKPRTKK